MLYAGKHTQSIFKNEKPAWNRRRADYVALVHHSVHNRLQLGSSEFSIKEKGIPFYYSKSPKLRWIQGTSKNVYVFIELRTLEHN